jgi:membrane protease YdiL (CAAX protease family)
MIGSFIGTIAPCFVAPVWEEILYRGFLLPCLYMMLSGGGCGDSPSSNSSTWNLHLLLPLSGILFAWHHAAVATMIPLTVVGTLWAYIYMKSGNLLVTMVIHMLWNMRVFLDPHIS